MIQAPDPIVGFRYWLWPPLMPDFVRKHFPWGESILLWGTVGMAPWSAAQLRATHAWGRNHIEPFEDCQCGIHGFTRLRPRPKLAWFDHWPSAMFNHEMGLVAGAIIVWGRVAEHGTVLPIPKHERSEGFRAQNARILALADPRAAQLYRVPHVAENGLELYASEFGLRLDELHQ